MKQAPLSGVVLCVITPLILAGCVSPDVRNTKKDRDDYARMENHAKELQKPDGSLSGVYVIDTLLNGSGKTENKPVFDQPRGDGNVK